MAFQTEAKKVDLNDIKTNITNTRDDARRFVSTTNSTAKEFNATNTGWASIDNAINQRVDALSGDTSGINGGKVQAMQDAIRAYVNMLNGHLEGIEVKARTDTAFKGAYAETTTKFVERLKQSCKNIISNLLMFNDKLETIKKAYTSRAETMAADISEQNSTMENAFKEYKENGGSAQ